MTDKMDDLQAKAKATAEQLKDKASVFAADAKPRAEKAATAASHQVPGLAKNLKKWTKGRFDKQIDEYGGKLEQALDRSKPEPGDPASS